MTEINADGSRIVIPNSKKIDVEFGLSEPNNIKFTNHDGKILAEIPMDKHITTGIETRLFKLSLRKADLELIKDDIYSLGTSEDKSNYLNLVNMLRNMKEDINSLQFYTYLEDFDERMVSLRIQVEELRKVDLECQRNDDDTKPDMVNHPAHYNVNGFEVIDIIKAFTEGLEGIQAVDTANAIKYILRWHHKNGVEDLKKARWYIDHLIKEIENKIYKEGK